MIGQVGRQLADDELLEDVGASIHPDANERVFEDERSATLARRIVEIRNATRRNASENTGIVRLPVTIVAFADHSIGDRVHQA